MTTHDDTLHTRDNASGEFTTKSQTQPEAALPGIRPEDLAVQTLEAEYAENSAARNALDVKEYDLAVKILNAKISAAGLDGVPHTLTLRDGNYEGHGSPYWEPAEIIDADGKVLWEADEDQLADDLANYTAVLDRRGNESLVLPDGNRGIVLTGE